MEAFRAAFFDGRSAARHVVRVALSEDRMALVIEGDSLAAALKWPLSDLRANADHAEMRELVLTRHQANEEESPRDAARLIVEDPAAVAWFHRTRPNLFKRDLRPGTGRKIMRNLTFAVGAVALMLFVILPAMASTLARIIPLEREIAFGKVVTGQMERFLGGTEAGDLVCENTQGRAALNAMTARLIEGRALDYELNVQVFDHGMVNAFAAPGGQIVLLRGLLEEADGPDAVAAVLAHEIAHVVNRDATRASLQSVGSAGLLSLIIGDVTGGAVAVAVGEQLLTTAYSREAENKADIFAIEMLNGAGISTEGMGAFFDYVQELQGDATLPEYLSTHPDSGARGARARENARSQSATTPALSEAQWAALQAVCS